MSFNGFASLDGKLPLYCHHEVHAALLPVSAHGLNGKRKGLEAKLDEVFGGAVDGENGVHDSGKGGSSRLVEPNI